MRKASIMPKAAFKPILLDKVFLLVTAIIVLAALLGLMIYVGDVLALSRQWIFFVLGSLLYTMCGVYLLFKATSFASLKFSQKVVSLAIVEFPVLAFFLIFYLGLLPLPDRMWPYWIGSIVLPPVATLCLELCLKRGRRKRDKSNFDRLDNHQ